MNTVEPIHLVVRPNDPSNVSVVTYLRESLRTLCLPVTPPHRFQVHLTEYQPKVLKHYQRINLVHTPTRIETQGASEHEHEHACRALFEKIVRLY